MDKTAVKSNTMGEVRIIGGQWRSRKLRFPTENVRPTTDRIRETLFNWLAPVIHDANCLDLFAGSGALSFEALSRGAAQVTCIDASVKMIEAIRRNAEILQTNALYTINAKFPDQITTVKTAPFDIIFLDPPYQQNLANMALAWVAHNNYLKENGLIYVETEKAAELVLPQNWQIHRAKETHAIRYYLVTTA